jgi:hypothetical protein
VMVERGPVIGPGNQHGVAVMEHYVSLEWSSVCIVDASGKMVREAQVRSQREALVGFFAASVLRFARIGLEAGPLSQWRHAGLVEADGPRSADPAFKMAVGRLPRARRWGRSR